MTKAKAVPAKSKIVAKTTGVKAVQASRKLRGQSSPVGQVDEAGFTTRKVIRLETGAFSEAQLAQLVTAFQQRAFPVGIDAAAASEADTDAKTVRASGSISDRTSLAKGFNPLDNEIDIQAGHLESIHQAITDLNSMLAPVMVYDEVDSKTDNNVGRGADTPMHRRMMDRTETMESILYRLNTLKDRIRT